jgi:long-chain-fatty-acid--CoA ligase ACSBG
LVETLNWAKPTLFFAVPRVWEKFEETLKGVAAQKPAILQSISGWAKGYGTANTEAKMKGEPAPLMYSVANALILSKIKAAIGLDQCEYFAYGAAPLKQTSVAYWASLDMPLINIYGMSETTGAHIYMSHNKFKLTTSGMVMPGCEILIDRPDEKGEGEICMRGRNIMMGYLKNETATQETIDSEGFLHSGDRGIVDPEGFLRITGRIKELIITAGGENVAPVPIEDNFKEVCPPCANIMVVGEQQRFMGALVTFKVDIDPVTGVPTHNLMPDTVAFFKSELGVDVKTSDEACADAKIKAYIEKCVEATNGKSVSRAAHMRKVKLVADDFSVPGGELTPTLKLKRPVATRKYQALLDEMFAPEAKL